MYHFFFWMNFVWQTLGRMIDCMIHKSYVSLMSFHPTCFLSAPSMSAWVWVLRTSLPQTRFKPSSTTGWTPSFLWGVVLDSSELPFLKIHRWAARLLWYVNLILSRNAALEGLTSVSLSRGWRWEWYCGAQGQPGCVVRVLWTVNLWIFVLHVFVGEMCLLCRTFHLTGCLCPVWGSVVPSSLYSHLLSTTQLRFTFLTLFLML